MCIRDRPEVAFAQMVHETNFLKFTGDVKVGQFNFAGLGATGGGNPGNSFATVQEGIRAHIQHLYLSLIHIFLKNIR